MADSLAATTRRWCLIAAGAGALPLLVQIPVGLAFALLVAGALGALSGKPWPGWLRLLMTAMLSGLVLAAYGFQIGRDTASAGLLAMLMLKPSETYSTRDARSLLGFSLFAPFSAFLQNQGPLTMALCLLALLLSLSAWSAMLPGNQAKPAVPQLRRAGLALLMALPMALAGFWLFPRLASPLWGLPGKSTGAMGLGDSMRPSDWLDVLVDDSPALRAHFFGRTPPREQMYWRGPVLTHFDGQTWTRRETIRPAAAPALRAIGETVRYEVMLEPTERRDLLLLDLPQGAPSIASLNSELTAVTSEPIDNLVRYRGQSAPRAQFTAALANWERYEALALPGGHDPRIRDLAQQWRAQTPDPLKLTQRFLQWVRKDFQYTLAAPPLGYHATDEFLFDTRQGYCQHFSSAFVVFMRAAGIPARIVTGYVGGHYNRVGDYWLLYRKDAHAWAEIWIEGHGWQRVDPTAAVAPENILDTVDDLQAGRGFAGVANGMLRPVLDGTDFLRRQWNELALGFNAARQKTLLRPLGIREADAWQLVLAFMVGAGLALALTLGFLLRQHRDRSDPLVRAWRNFVRRLQRAGFAKTIDEPPLSYANRVAERLPGAAQALRSVSQRYCDWRYAGLVLSDDEKRSLIRRLRRFPLSRLVTNGENP